MEKSDKVILITGSSSGIGRSCAQLLHDAGYKVYGTVRKEMNPPPPFRTVIMNVDSDESVWNCVNELASMENQIDVVVNCAGFGIAGAVEDTSIEEGRAQFETNFFGVMRVCREVIPHMREKGAGLIINISSLGGIVSAPFHGIYCASKFAIEGMTEALRMEVHQFGIKVVLVEPGDYRTNFTGSRKIVAAATGDSSYRKVFDKSLKAMEKNEQTGPDPIVIAKKIRTIIEAPDPALRYAVAPGIQKLVPFLKKFLPYRIFEKEIMKQFGLLK